jgi:hypothetical protein
VADLQPYVEREEREDRTAFFLPLLAASLILALIGVISVVTGGDEAVEDPTALVRSAPDALQEAGSARMTMTMGMEGGAMSMEMGGTGLVDFVTGGGTFEMAVMGQAFEIRTDGELLWMKMPAMALPPGVEGSWLEVPLDEMPGIAPGGFAAPSGGYVDALRGLSSEIEELGVEEIDGVDTNHYRFDVSIEAALEELDEEDRAALEQSFEALGDVETLPVELWITDDGLPIRQVMTFALAEAGFAGTMRIQIDMSDFGVDVDVEPPPAEEIISFDEHPELEELIGSGAVS